jgi:Putative polyhydroxyalkanoic acid system protein (PHA_gran_rgn)
MAPVKISIPHGIGRAEARRRLSEGLARMPVQGHVAIDQQVWVEDRMTFKVRAFGAAMPGLLEVGDDTVRLEIELPAILRRFAEQIKPALVERARLLLGKP